MYSVCVTLYNKSKRIEINIARIKERRDRDFKISEGNIYIKGKK